MQLTVDNQLVGLAELRKVWLAPLKIKLGMQAKQRVTESSELITEVLDGGEQVYGVNTGFGQLAQVRVSDEDLAQLQANLVRSHAVGVGENLPDNIVRLVMTMKIIALAEGFSGVRLKLITTLCELVNKEIYPCIPVCRSVR
jgi:histidine ammonia-lyase